MTGQNLVIDGGLSIACAVNPKPPSRDGVIKRE
jgi:hypothetical protein